MSRDDTFSRRALLAAAGAGLATVTATTTVAQSDPEESVQSNRAVQSSESHQQVEITQSNLSEQGTVGRGRGTRGSSTTVENGIVFTFRDCGTVRVRGRLSDAEWVSAGTLYEMPDGRILSGVIDEPAAFSVTIDANEFYGDSIVGEAIITGVTVSGADGPLASASPPEEWDCADLVGSE